jgi:hypothetical protein
MKRCPFCSGIQLTVATSAELYWVACQSAACGAEGPMRDTHQQAMDAWDRAPRPDPTGTCRHLEYCPVCNPALKDRT